MGFWELVQGLGLRVSGLGCWGFSSGLGVCVVYVLGFRVWDLVCLGFGEFTSLAYGLGCRSGLV